jgi:hypothetical protein
MTDIKIWIRYVRKAVQRSDSACRPASIRRAPNHSTATLERSSTNITMGKRDAI